MSKSEPRLILESERKLYPCNFEKGLVHEVHLLVCTLRGPCECLEPGNDRLPPIIGDMEVYVPFLSFQLDLDFSKLTRIFCARPRDR